MVTSGNTMNLIKDGLTASSLRSQAIANNIANVNTEGYKKFTVLFEENLKNKDESSIELRKTREDQITKDTSDSIIELTKEESTSMRSDGNNVDLDIEKVNQAANNLMYNTLISQLNNRLSITKYVINGGGN